MISSRLRHLLLSVPLASGLTPLGAAQTFKLEEGFEDLAGTPQSAMGPPELIARGWSFSNQSEPAEGPAWQSGLFAGFAHSGVGSLSANSWATDWLGGELSTWAVLPSVTGQAAGDLLSAWILGSSTDALDVSCDVMYSPGGGTNTGSSPTDVGDFSVRLLSTRVPMVPGEFAYAPIQASLPGAGRIALRFHAPWAFGQIGGPAASVYIDDLTIGDAPPDPCGLRLPAAGETVRWTLAGSPYTICQDLVLVEGGTLEVDPGVTIVVETGRNLEVRGTLRALGSAARRVSLLGDDTSGFLVEGGSVELAFADVDLGVYVQERGRLVARDANFGMDGRVGPRGPSTFMRFERVDFAAELYEFGGTTVFEDVSFSDPEALVEVRGFWRMEGDGIDSVAALQFSASMQDRAIERVQVTGVPGPALVLESFETETEFHLDPSNTLLGNDYPVWTRSVGLTHDSVVPAAGNAQNAILGVERTFGLYRSRLRMPDLGVPYHFLERGQATGDILIEPGAVLRFGPLGGFSVGGDFGTDACLRGLPGRPLRFERLDPNAEWFSLATGPGWHVFEHLEIDGAGIGVVANEARLFLRDSRIENCSIGLRPAAQGSALGSGLEFRGNDIGVHNDVSNPSGSVGSGIRLDGFERPNVFENNALAAKNMATPLGNFWPFHVAGNYWDDPSGPTNPIYHPPGQGQPFEGDILFEPFLTTPPDLSDERPVVRLVTRLHPIVHPGEKIFLEWEASDDGALTRFDVRGLDPGATTGEFLNLIPGLAPERRRVEFVVPHIGSQLVTHLPFRIVATDDAGQEGFEQFWLVIPAHEPAGDVRFHTQLGEFRGGERIDVCYDAIDLESDFPRIWIETAADDRMAQGPNGHPGADECAFSPLNVPYASTDRARIALRAKGNSNNEEWYFSDYFTIRPDPSLGDDAPEIELLAPSHGTSFFGAGAIQIVWSADDDKGLRGFRIQASSNGGHTFHTIADELAASARSFVWDLPPSTGVDDLRLRVVAIDTMLQNSSDGDERILHVLPRGRVDGDPTQGGPPTAPR